MAQNNPVGWFEIPVTNMARAVEFYESVFSVKLVLHDFGALKMAMFAHDDGYGAGGSLVEQRNHYKPSPDGVLVYFTTPTGNLDEDCARVVRAGGKVLVPKKRISEAWGWMCAVLDTEGNRIAIHARTQG